MLLDKLNVFCKPVFPHLSRQITYCKKSLKVGKNTQEKIHATCLATLLQNELNSDVVRFTTHIKPVLQQIRSLTGLNFQKKAEKNEEKAFDQDPYLTCTQSVERIKASIKRAGNKNVQLVLQHCCKMS